MSAAPTVSVVVPARDDAPALEACLRMLARQTTPPHEVVVVDNASSDDTAAVARAAGARVVHEPRLGIAPAAARGYDEATGDVIARCDADTRVPPDWVRRISRRMADDPALEALTGVGVFHDVPPLARHLASLLYLGAYYLLSHLALGHTALWGSCMAVRRRTWEEVRDRVHRDDPEVHDDMDLAFALGPHRRVRLDLGLRVGVSGRSLRGSLQRRRRLDRARRTLRLNWAVAPPWARWQRRFSRPPVTNRG